METYINIEEGTLKKLEQDADISAQVQALVRWHGQREPKGTCTFNDKRQRP